MIACNLPVFCVLTEIRHYHIIKWYKQPHMHNPTENHRERLGVYCWTSWCKSLKKKKKAIWPSAPAHLFAYSENKNRHYGFQVGPSKWENDQVAFLYEFMSSFFLLKEMKVIKVLASTSQLGWKKKNVQNFDLSVAIGQNAY